MTFNIMAFPMFKKYFLVFLIFGYLSGNSSVVNGRFCDLKNQTKSICGPNPKKTTVTKQQCEKMGCCYNATSSECYTPWQNKLVLTLGSKSKSSQCYFPFIYKGIAYFDCIMHSKTKRMWCGTVNNYDKYKYFNYCNFDCKYTVSGWEYSGKVSSSRNFSSCKEWKKTKFTNKRLYPGYSFSKAKNFCRNPDKDPKGPWCYNQEESSPVKREYCDIPSCVSCNSSFLNTKKFQGTIKASSETSGNLYSANYGRIGQKSGWCANDSDQQPYLEVTFEDTRRVWGIVTQAVKGESYWTTEYKFKYSKDSYNYTTYLENNTDKLFTGNNDAKTQVGYTMKTIYGKGFRIYPTKFVGSKSNKKSMACLKWDLIGCTDDNECTAASCQNGGTCIDGLGSITCQCAAGWTGQNCTISIDDCVDNKACMNGGVCIDGVNNYTCKCPTVYSGRHCENGFGRSCIDIFKSGSNNISTYYNIKFYNDVLSDACEMMKLPFYLNFIRYKLPSNVKNKYKNFRQITRQKCNKLCLEDKTCTLIRYKESNSLCTKWNLQPSYYAKKILVGYYKPSNTETYIKECPEVRSTYCDMTNHSVITTTIEPVLDFVRYYGNSKFQDKKFASKHLIFYKSITKRQIDYLRYDSYSCEQKLGVKCQNTYDKYQGFLMADEKNHSLLSRYDQSCPCFLTNVCSVDPNATTCYCGSSQDKDEGIIKTKELLPIQAYLFGDVNEKNETIRFWTGDMICTQTMYDTDECTSNPCTNNGTCTDGHYNFTCTCLEGYTGNQCELDLDECLSSPCYNGATCTDRFNGYNCTCAAGWTGTHCDTNIDECASYPCKNDGSCVDEVNWYRCLCWKGTMGELCELEVDDCIESTCYNGSTCQDLRNNYTCICEPGYGGGYCEYDIDECLSTPCRNGATCTDMLNSYKCTCPAGFKGTYCEKELYECESAPCQNNGNCRDEVAGYTCVCPPGFSGVHCETDLDECISNPCVHGTCQDSINGYMCTCQSGYTGRNCNEEEDECVSSPCQNNATCLDKVDSFSCMCHEGYEGDHCETDINECRSYPCKNDGYCTDLIGGYRCKCVTGFTGAICHLVIIDGQWGGWGPWTQCSVKCGKGVHTRTRSCNNPLPKNSGDYCTGEQAQVELCFSETCVDVDGQWGMWGSWSKCSHTCNYGTKVRTRLCDTPPPKGKGLECVGAGSSTAACKVRNCGSPVDGSWSMWGKWGDCSTTCGVGASYRTRQCDQPKPAYGGKQCQGFSSNWKPCFVMKCPRYHPCSDWEEWAACSATCGDGQTNRQRTCFLDKDTIDENITSVNPSIAEYEVQHCEDMACREMECYQCSSSFTGDIESLTCKGPTKQCRPDQQYCMYAFSKVPGNNQTVGITKRCADTSECTSQLITEQCKAIYDQTIDSIITENENIKGPLEPHPDTLAQMWDALVIQCNICCKSTRCNRGLLPAGNTIYTGTAGAVRQYTIVTVLGVIVTLLFHNIYKL